MSVAALLEIHDFVSLDNELGVGQVASIDGDHVEISYFDSITNPQAYQITAPIMAAQRVALERQRRCYAQVNGLWWVGRVIDHEGKRYRVRLRLGGELWLDADHLRVRWNRPLPDPLEDLIGLNWWAHPVGVALRRQFLDSFARQREAVLGLTGISSLAAEVHAHQVEIARRVLDDPVGRFLLADEVGLGKTVEALMIVRQFLLDDPEAHVRVIAPTALRAQWRHELLGKAFIDPSGGGDFPYSRVEVFGMGEPGAWRRGDALDLLVIDEAHRVAAWANSPSADARRSYAAAERLTEEASCVLLVSATPSLHSPDTFLALLHLLDPHRHDLGDIAGFEAQLARRDAVASALLGAHADDPPAILSESLRDLVEVVPSDDPLRDELRALADQVEAADASDSYRAAVERLKLQVAERFRVDRRMLRTRRLAVERRFPIRGRQLGNAVVTDSTAFEEADAWFERWRSALLVDYTDADEAVRDRVATLVGLVADHVMGAPGLLAPLAGTRLGVGADADRALLDLSAPETDIVEGGSLPVGDQERGELARVPMLSGCLPEDYGRAIAEHVWGHRASSRVVVMTSFKAAAQDLFESLTAVLEEDEVALHIRGATSDANEKAVERFVSDDDRCHVLVCDQSGEEGLNLQVADVLVLADLPLAADRLEQRLGRADRFSHRDKVTIEVVQTGGRTDLRSAWTDLLTQGYRIFERSIAAFQVAVAESLPILRQRLFEDGPEGLRESAPWVMDKLTAAERELTRSELLDATWIEQAGSEIAQMLTEIDQSWAEWRSIADRLIAKSLRLVRWHHSDDIVSFWLKHQRLPDIEPEIDGQHRADYFVDAVSHGRWARRSTYDRAVAVAHPRIRLLRAGDPLIDSVERYLRERHDDGRVTAIWRKTSRLPDDRPQVGFTFHFSNHIPLPDAAAEMPARDQALLRRRLLAVFPPRSTTVRTSVDAAVLDEDDDLALLASFDYDPRRGDSLLYPPAFDAIRALAPGDWEDICRRAGQTARAAARATLGLEPVDELRAAAHRAGEARLGVLRGRSASRGVLEREAMLNALVEEALASADVRLETIELVVVSDEDPPSVRRLQGIR